MCNCAEKAIENGYIIRGATYDEGKKDFQDTNEYTMPLVNRDQRGRIKTLRLVVKCCPICG